jgi:hypothetical protein
MAPVMSADPGLSRTRVVTAASRNQCGGSGAPKAFLVRRRIALCKEISAS